MWLGLAVVIALVLFLQSSRTVTLASHDAVLRPNLHGDIVVETGPVLPDIRLESGQRIGVDIILGKTEAESTEDLMSRYGVIASQPAGVEKKIRDAVVDMAVVAVVRGLALGVLPMLLWFLVGSTRRSELLLAARRPQALIALALVAAVVLATWQPWRPDDETVDAQREWMTLGEFLGPAVPLPAEVDGLEVRGDTTTNQTRRLIESAVDTFEKSKTFYAKAAADAADLEVRTPEESETVVLLVSDRHDNVGMDQVARAIADTAGATGVFDAGDDTSTGQPWEAFSLDSLSAAFDDDTYADTRWAVPGNHDHGGFVPDYLADQGWRVLDGEIVDGPGDSSLLGVHDPRSSGLGSWRDETGANFSEVAAELADTACAAADDGERISTVLVHDANLGRELLARGCADLVVGGHLHVRVGPDPVVGENGEVGYSYTNGTTGGAAYAIAIGSKIRRTAEVSLITYAEGRPVGVQAVELQTNGRFVVRDYEELTYEAPVGTDVDPAPEQTPAAPEETATP